MESSEFSGKTSAELYAAWQEGSLDGATYLKLLSRQLVALEDRLEPLQGMRESLRSVMSEIVQHQGGRAVVDGFGVLMISAPAHTISYDQKGLDNLTLQLLATGDNSLVEVAHSIASLRKESSRSGGLRINRGSEK